MMPDSVQARHILLPVNTQEDLQVQQALADSLKNVIEGGGNFATLALQYSRSGFSCTGRRPWMVQPGTNG
jgi:peptidyl-prolyl cis-trans isomerase D